MFDPNAIRNVMEKRNIESHLVDFNDFLGIEINQPLIPEGQEILTIINCTINQYGDEKKITIEFEDSSSNKLLQIFNLSKNPIMFIKFIYQILGYLPQGQFDLLSLVGEKINAVIYHFYFKNGVGYANIAYCFPPLEKKNYNDNSSTKPEEENK